MALALTAALTFTPIADVMGERWIADEYVDAIRKEAHHRNPSGSDVVAPPPTLAELVAAYFRPEDVAAALRVIDCESGFLLTADNPRSTAWGPWQFLRSTWNWVAEHTGSPLYDTGAPTDPKWSTINASWLWYSVGPEQWTCYERGW